MKYAELMSQLEMIKGDFERAGIDIDDVEVRLMHQPSWPFEYSIDGITHTTAINAEERYAHGEDAADDDGGPEIIYLLEGTQLKYGKKSAWDAKVW